MWETIENALQDPWSLQTEQWSLQNLYHGETSVYSESKATFAIKLVSFYIKKMLPILLQHIWIQTIKQNKELAIFKCHSLINLISRAWLSDCTLCLSLSLVLFLWIFSSVHQKCDLGNLDASGLEHRWDLIMLHNHVGVMANHWGLPHL